MNETTIPGFNKNAFTCPFCGVFAFMKWAKLVKDDRSVTRNHIAKCSSCGEESLWQQTYNHDLQIFSEDRGILIFPDTGVITLPEVDMPEDVQKEYYEAASVFSKSPRASAALLRLGLQKLCRHLGEEGKNINDDIRNLAAKGVLSPIVIKVADTVRIVGNNAVHPGEMADEDIDYIASKMFNLLNVIVKRAITEPKELENLYQMTPVLPRKAAEEKDVRAQSKKPQLIVKSI